MKLKNIPQQINQPNGEIIDCFTSGDEYFNYLHDVNGFIIIRDEYSGTYSYAIYIGNKVTSSKYILSNTLINNVSKKTHEGIITISDINIYDLQYIKENSSINIMNDEQNITIMSQNTLNNIVIFIRFSDQSEYTSQISSYNNLFNSQELNYNSMYNYFKADSYNKFTVTSYLYPTSTTTILSYQDNNPRPYYQQYNIATNPIGYKTQEDIVQREHILLKNAVNDVSSQISSNINVDENNDGYVDNVVFVVRGTVDGWSSLLWPHKWALYSQVAYINNKRVWNYNFQLETVINNSVLCHEMCHSIGYPDLYHYSFDGLNPVGPWDIMANNLNPPQHNSLYTKYRYGQWIDSIPEITAAGRYTINSVAFQSNNGYIIKSKKNTSEYFVVEYRSKDTIFEGTLPGSGLLVYRINESRDGLGNQSGPPDEIYVYRPGGNINIDGNYNNAFLSQNSNRTSIGGSQNPLFFSNGEASEIIIENIGQVGDTISFDVRWENEVVVINIIDEKLKALINHTINPSRPINQDITKDEIEKIKYLNGSRKGISDLTGLEYAINLSTLYLDYNNIVNIQALVKLSKLTTLNLSNNNIKIVPSISNMKSLNLLALQFNYIEDISGISSLTTVRYLMLNNNKIKDMRPISAFTKLSYYNISNQNIDLISTWDEDNIIMDITSLKNTDSSVVALISNISDSGVYNGTTKQIVWSYDENKVNYTFTFKGRSGFSGKVNINLEDFVIKIKDSNFEEILNYSINNIRFKNQKIYKKEMETIKKIESSNKNISNINGIKFATNIYILDISNNNINDMSNIVKLKKLKKVDISGNDTSTVVTVII